MENLFNIIRLLIKQKFTGTLRIDFFEGGVRAAHQDQKVI